MSFSFDPNPNFAGKDNDYLLHERSHGQSGDYGMNPRCQNDIRKDHKI